MELAESVPIDTIRCISCIGEIKEITGLFSILFELPGQRGN